MAQLPVLPHGSPTTLSGLFETFSFHSSPEAFITSRFLALQASNPELAKARTPIRAKVLNRNVCVISSYDQVKQCLCDEATASKLSSSKAYDELMAPFFPSPNLLLAEPPGHGPMKEAWNSRMSALLETAKPVVQRIAIDHFKAIHSGSSIDLYESMKTLSWKILLTIFMSSAGLDPPTEHDTNEIETLQETLLRGQFSLFPVSISARIWQSPRSKGLEARKQLQSLFASRVKRGTESCPFATSNTAEKNEVASHLLLFTSSLAVKALASLLTAVMMNLYLIEESSKGDDHADGIPLSLAARIMMERDDAKRSEVLRNIILETERMSPPVVGLMRRATQDIILQPPTNHGTSSPTLIPKGWDVWLYFVGAARDPAIFGETAESFLPNRYMKANGESKEGFAFGAGPKSCLGQNSMREIAMTVAKTCLGMESARSGPEGRSLIITGDMNQIPKGVQGWLGWKGDVTPEEWAKDMKQLPSQRPLKPFKVTISREAGARPKVETSR